MAECKKCGRRFEPSKLVGLFPPDLEILGVKMESPFKTLCPSCGIEESIEIKKKLDNAGYLLGSAMVEVIRVLGKEERKKLGFLNED